MVSYLEALAQIRKVALEMPRDRFETVPLIEAVGRIAASDIVSPEVVPPFANSSMDGFALRSELTAKASAQNPVRFKVVGSIAAGDAPPTSRADEAGAWEIMTGASFPEGYDASVKVEDCKVTRDVKGAPIEIEITKALEHRENWRGPGDDFQIGSAVVAKGAKFMPEQILALASLGITEISVVKKLRVGVISTGKELVPMSEKIEAGQIRNSTGPFLLSVLKLMGVEATHLGTIHDEPEVFQDLMKRLLKNNEYDVLITTGAVSMGKFDFVTEGVDRLGAEVFFHKTAIRPGKPLLFARFKNGTILFGLPGNPVSGVVGVRFFFDAFLRAYQGQKPETPIKARLSENTRKPEGLRCFFKSQISSGEAGLKSTILQGQMSFMVSSLLASTAWTILSEEGKSISAGALVDVYPFYSQPYDWQAGTLNGSQSLEGCC